MPVDRFWPLPAAFVLATVGACSSEPDPCVQYPTLCAGDDDSASDGDDDVVIDDDTSASDDDTSMADDDTSGTGDDDSSGDDDIVGDDDDDTAPPLPPLECLWIQELPAPSPLVLSVEGALGPELAAALDWSITWALFDDARGARDAWYERVEARSTDSCPVFVHVRQQGGVPCYGANSMTFDQDSWTAPCTNDWGEDVTSSLVSTLREESCAETGPNPPVTTESTGHLAGSFSIADDGLPDAGPGELMLAVALDWQSVVTAGATISRNAEHTLDLNLTQDGADTAWWESVLPGESLVVVSAGSTEEESDAVSGAVSSRDRLAQGSATLCPMTLPLESSWDLLWSWNGTIGCADEPTGTVLVEAPDFWEGPAEVLSLTFDGATNCDGCGAVQLDGAEVGTVCLP